MRHVTVTGLAEEPKPGDLTGCEISSLYTPSGDFKCSDERITWLHDCVRRTMVAYTTFLPNDPVRVCSIPSPCISAGSTTFSTPRMRPAIFRM
jgi:hypothetical protein